MPDLASEITESLADLIVTGSLPEEQPRLLDRIVSELERFVTEKRKTGLAGRLLCAAPVLQSKRFSFVPDIFHCARAE